MVVMKDDATQESGTPRAGELERFAIDEALRAARLSVFWNTHRGRFEYGFVDYFEATVARNLAGLAELEELGEAMGRRGIVPQSDDDQAKLVTDGGTLRCAYCDSEDLVYELQSGRGPVVRCIPCLAIEQGQEKFTLPFDVWLDQDDIEPPESEDAPDFDAFDPREHDYEVARAWFKVLARLVEDDPLVKRDPDDHGTIFEDTREFLINIMGEDAHKPPSEVAGSCVRPAQATFDGGED